MVFIGGGFVGFRCQRGRRGHEVTFERAHSFKLHSTDNRALFPGGLSLSSRNPRQREFIKLYAEAYGSAPDLLARRAPAISASGPRDDSAA